MKRRRNSMEELRNDLIYFYRERLACLPIAPLEEHHDAPLHHVYVQPELNVADKPTLGGVVTKSKKVPIYQYKDLFEPAGVRKKKIYITAGAGMGKTSYAKKMALTWCQAWQHEKDFENKFESYDVETMNTFKMLFFVQLRDTNSDDVDKMIQESVKWSCRTTDESIIQEALNTDTCLIILDGLDQWQTNKSIKKECWIPFVKYTKCTVLTTSRPGSIVNLRTNDIDMHVKLSKLTRRASQQLEINFIRHLKAGRPEFEIMKDVDEFDALISESKLEEVRYTPYILQQELCLWNDKGKVRKSMFESYKNVVELAFNREFKGKRPVEQTKEKNHESISVPAHIQDTKMCQMHYRSLLQLGDTALKMLCEQRIVMKEANVYKGDLLELFSSAGILTITKDMEKISKIVRMFSFQERSIQEFFAALYMAGEWNNMARRKEMVKKCIELPDMMELKNVLSFVKDIDDNLHLDMYKTLVLRSNLSTYIDESTIKTKIVRLYGGRFTQFEESDVETIVQEVESDKTVIGRGSFGSVHKSCKFQRTYGILAVKKVHCTNNKDVEKSIRQECRASKLLHPFLLSVMTIYRTVAEENKTYYLILPYCQKGDLYEALHGQKKLELDWLQRARVIIQVACGIEYLHSGTGQPMIHKDICTKNIVLDRKYNARLIDYSIARDQEDITTGTSARLCYHNEKETSATKKSDYFSFGVVIRELLTNKKAESTKNNQKLKLWKSEEIAQGRDKKIWSNDGNFNMVSRFADRCLSADDTFSLRTEVIDELQTVFHEEERASVRIPDDEERCILCLVNKGSLEPSWNMHAANCTEPRFKICFACERNSFFSPIECYACRKELKPIIGKDWWAVLVAGNDEDETVAEGFSNDVEDMRKLVISTAPLIMGIRETNVKVVKPDKPSKTDKEKLVSKFEAKMKEIKKEMNGLEKHTSKTLLVYFLCHGDRNGHFKLGLENDTLEKKKMEQLLDCLKAEKVIMFMDRCYPPEIELQEGTKKLQLNACKIDEETSVASPFTKHLVEVMTERKAPDSKENIITATTLLERVSQRFEEHNIVAKPVFYSPGGLQYKDMKIAYCNAQPLTVTVLLGERPEKIEVDSFRSLEDFKTDILSLFQLDQNKYSVEILRDTIKRTGVAEHEKGDRDKAKTGRVQEICSSMQDIIMARVLQETLTVNKILLGLN